MNEFKYLSTFLPDFTFSRYPGQEIRGDVSVSVNIGIPKDLNEHKMVRCILLVELIDQDTEEISIKLRSISDFDIINPEIDQATLLEDARKYCTPISLQKTDKKITELSHSLIGEFIDLQLFRHFQ